MRIGIDLGGTKIEGVALGRDGAIVARKRVPTPQGDYQGTIDAIVALIHHLEKETGERPPVGIGMPGIISPVTGRVKNANSVCLNGTGLGPVVVRISPQLYLEERHRGPRCRDRPVQPGRHQRRLHRKWPSKA